MAYCCVPGCKSYQRRKGGAGLSFHRFPTDSETRSQWIVRIRRDIGPYFRITDNTRVCSKHFPKDCMVKSLTGLNKLKIGSVPSLFTWSEPRTRTVLRFQSLRSDSEEEEEKDVRNLHKDKDSNQIIQALRDHDYNERTLSVEDQLDAARWEIARLQEENRNLRNERFLLRRFQCEPKLIMFYTGFKDYDTLKAVFLALKPTAESVVRWSQMQRLNQTEEHVVRARFHAQRLSLFDQFFLFLCRVRQGFFSMDLAVRFNVSQATISRTCITWGNYLFFMFGTLPIWPSREAVDELMPPFFKKTFPKARVVLHCAEIHIQAASSKVLDTVTHSHSKRTTALRSLLGITPSGSISLVSNLYRDCISDMEITRKSGILSLLEPGDEVIADSEFLIKDLLSDINVKLITPTSLEPSVQLSQKEIPFAVEIARLRSHVEKAVGRIKEYHIFNGVMPLSLCGSANQLWTVCAHLTNFQGRLF